MAKITGKYEVLYIIDPTLGEEGTAALVEKFKAMVEAEGTLSNVDEWGKKRLAYEIQKIKEGYYYFIQFHVVFTHNYTHIFGCGKCYGAISYIRYLQHVSYAGFE